MCICVCVIAVWGTFSLSSRLIARARASCSSSSPLVVGRACSRSGAIWGEEDEATEEEQRGFRVKGEEKHWQMDIKGAGEVKQRATLWLIFKVRKELVQFLHVNVFPSLVQDLGWHCLAWAAKLCLHWEQWCACVGSQGDGGGEEWMGWSGAHLITQNLLGEFQGSGLCLGERMARLAVYQSRCQVSGHWDNGG